MENSSLPRQAVWLLGTALTVEVVMVPATDKKGYLGAMPPDVRPGVSVRTGTLRRSSRRASGGVQVSAHERLPLPSRPGLRRSAQMVLRYPGRYCRRVAELHEGGRKSVAHSLRSDRIRPSAEGHVPRPPQSRQRANVPRALADARGPVSRIARRYLGTRSAWPVRRVF